jgi:methionyl-tRNA formyltransferase
MNTIKTVFFGSTADSVRVLETLPAVRGGHLDVDVVAVVTQPAKPVGREKTVTNAWEYADPERVTNAVESFSPDLLVTACYGQKIPADLIRKSRYGGLNVHPSLLPRWRGADPLPWTILSGDAQTGVTVSMLGETFDTGGTVAQQKLPVTDTDTPDDLRSRLFAHGASLLAHLLPEYVDGTIKPVPQKPEEAVYARKLTREDGRIDWPAVTAALEGADLPHESRSGLLTAISEPLPAAIVRMVRALSPWPGVWTLYPGQSGERRLKLLTVRETRGMLVPLTVQLEGKTPVSWAQFTAAYPLH